MATRMLRYLRLAVTPLRRAAPVLRTELAAYFTLGVISHYYGARYDVHSALNNVFGRCWLGCERLGGRVALRSISPAGE